MSDYPVRCVLEGVPGVHFFDGGPRCPEDMMLPSVMRAILEFLGDKEYGCRFCQGKAPERKVMCTYSFLAGVSGIASFISWKEGWHLDNPAPVYISADGMAAERHLFDAVGYEYEWLLKEPGHDNEALFRQRIMESIRKGIPVLGYGIVGPPEASIVAGYDQGGDVLIGWSFFQDPGIPSEPCGYFRKADWFNDMERLLIIGDKKTKPSLEDTCRTALQWMLQVTRTPMVRPEPDAPEPYRQRHNGLAAYETWAQHLLRDEEWPAGDEQALRAHHQVHNDAVGTVAEARWYGSVFMAETVERFAAGPGRRGAMEHVLHAAACYAAEHDLMWDLWALAGGIGNPEGYRAMADPTVRRAMADIVHRARDQDEQAAQYIERALAL